MPVLWAPYVYPEPAVATRRGGHTDLLLTTNLSPSCSNLKSTKPLYCCMSCSRWRQVLKNIGCTSLGTANLRGRAGTLHQYLCFLPLQQITVPQPRTWHTDTSIRHCVLRIKGRAHYHETMPGSLLTAVCSLLHTYLLMFVNCLAAGAAATAAGLAATGLAAAAAEAPLGPAACTSHPRPHVSGGRK